MATKSFGAKGFWLSYYYCNGRAWQSFEPKIDYWVETDAANRRYRVCGRAIVRASWKGLTALTLRNFRIQIGSQSYTNPSFPVNGNMTTYDWDVGASVCSQWYGFNADGSPSVTSIPMGYSFCFTHYTTANCGGTVTDCFGESGTQGVWVSINPIAPAYSAPSTPSLTCSATSNAVGKTVASVNVGVGNKTPVFTGELSTDSVFSTIISRQVASGSTTWNWTGLQPNTRYFVRATIDNGIGIKSNTCEFVTMAGNSLSNGQSIVYDKATMRLAIQGGDGVHAPNTKIWYKKCDSNTWIDSGVTSTTKTVANITVTGLEGETCYHFQARTTTAAGTYSGDYITITTPEQRKATAEFTKLEPSIDDTTQETTAEVCYKYQGNSNPITVTTYWRVKDGYVTTWEKHTATYDQNEGDDCFTIHDLFPNQTTYEVYMEVATEDSTWKSPISEFTTPLLSAPENFNCENFQYLVDLICQIMKALERGNKTIYPTPYTQELCDPYSDNPSLLTMWSRIQRFNHATACLTCEMIDLVMRSGKEDQYYVGEIGWVTMSQMVQELGEELVTSDAVHKHIQERLKEVWHFESHETYLIGTVAELPTNAENGESALVDENNKRYVYDGTTWNEDPDFAPTNFGVYNIRKASDTSFGKVREDSEYYYFSGEYHLFDADTSDIEETIAWIESHKPVQRQSATEDNPHITVVTEAFDFATLPSDRRTICFVIEEVLNPITADEYDALNLTAENYDSKDITATNYDKYAKELLG